MNSDVIQDTKIIYSLGNGCWTYSDIPKDYRVDNCLFKAAGGIKQNYFTPKFLFDSDMRNEYFKYENWSVRITQSNWLKEHVFDLIYQNNKCNIQFQHVNIRKDELSNIETINNLYFKPFDENKYNYLYIIDFSRFTYQKYTNAQLLDFEEFILNQGFNPKNFIYIDVSNAEIKDRFNGCQIPSFINDITDEKGFSIKDSPDDFRNTRCFFHRHIEYVKQQIDRINLNKNPTIKD